MVAVCVVGVGTKSEARDALETWISSQKPISHELLLKNVSPEGAAKGAIVASPSKSHPNYFFHWIRDASLVTSVLVDEYREAQSPELKHSLGALLGDALQFSHRVQAGNPLTGLGEPKFETDGSVFTGPWGRPQDDGPALRAIAYIELAEQWLKEGRDADVRNQLYRAEMPAASLIKIDLEYVANHWRETCFDLWEETRGHHFYTRMVQRKAMLMGASLAARLGDPNAAAWYRAQGAELTKEIERHWDAARGYLVATVDWAGGVDYKSSNLDTAVILGVLHGDNHDGFFSPGDDRVLATAAALETTFSSLYAINDPKKGFAGVAIGRYPEDRYDGDLTSARGNPWVLTTAAFAELYYRAAHALERRGSVEVTALNQPFFRRLGLELPLHHWLRTGRAAERGFSLDDIVVKLRQRGDGFLDRLRRIGEAAGGHFSEQINRDTGVMQGAYDLTWNYASLTTAFRARK